MAGFDNEVMYAIGERLQPSTAQAIELMQKTASDVSNINHVGNPEGVISANPSSLSHDPVSGDLYLKQTGFGSTGWIQITAGGGFNSINIQKFTTSGTYTPSPSMKSCIIECCGGGAGGGGTVVPGGTFYVGGGGGGGGGYSRKISSAAAIGASQTVTIGAGGAGGVAGNNAGSNGGDTSVGSICIGKGGTGGSGSDGTISFNGGNGGVAGTGDFTFAGGTGSSSSFINTGVGLGRTAPGGHSYFGQGGAESFPAGNSGPGLNGTGFGGGGGGGLCGGPGGSAEAGGNGTNGVIIVTEFIDTGLGATQPYFLVNMQTTTGNITGDGTIAPVIFDTIVFDNDSNITLNSGGKTIFTAPVTGKYHFDFGLLTESAAGNNTNITVNVVATSRQFASNNVVCTSGTFGGLEINVNSSMLIDMTAGDTVFLRLTSIGNSTKNVSIVGPSNTAIVTSYFSGYLIA